MNIRIELVSKDTYQEIFDFERKNKRYFETILPPRPDGYSQFESFIKIMDKLLVEQNQGEYYMYIIRDDKNRFVGRVNLQIYESENGKKADVGYRIDYDSQGLGIASQSVKSIVEKAFNEIKVMEVTAGTAKDNIGSKKVLEKNGFKIVGEEKNVFKIKDKWVDGLLYLKTK
ncbi:GNAT family protein [Fusibacter bizertensis]|uniref:GNAT family protein n=1 Tax=Fusibacter bizertensis TaxID=1488331 RepID=A0ABT6NH21_9FIRM|nr:GNAT family protein [Fusibacter bizertensis]MDH8679732.1 GNAT family protein [Fusibacter bizertensis]